MTCRFDLPGHGKARDGRCFSPTIPPGATVSWKPLASPEYIPEQGRMATHVVAVWDHFEQMNLVGDCFQNTPRGQCVAFYANRESLEDLVESAVPAPQGIDPRIPSELMLAKLVHGSYTEMRAKALDDEAMSPEAEVRWLHTAIWIHRVLTERWPVLGTPFDSVANTTPKKSSHISQETEQLFRIIKFSIDEQERSCWWERRVG